MACDNTTKYSAVVATTLSLSTILFVNAGWIPPPGTKIVSIFRHLIEIFLCKRTHNNKSITSLWSPSHIGSESIAVRLTDWDFCWCWSFACQPHIPFLPYMYASRRCSFRSHRPPLTLLDSHKIYHIRAKDVGHKSRPDDDPPNLDGNYFKVNRRRSLKYCVSLCDQEKSGTGTDRSHSFCLISSCRIDQLFSQ